jgi:hypothetical protein
MHCNNNCVTPNEGKLQIVYPLAQEYIHAFAKKTCFHLTKSGKSEHDAVKRRLTFVSTPMENKSTPKHSNCWAQSKCPSQKHVHQHSKKLTVEFKDGENVKQCLSFAAITAAQEEEENEYSKQCQLFAAINAAREKDKKNLESLDDDGCEFNVDPQIKDVIWVITTDGHRKKLEGLLRVPNSPLHFFVANRSDATFKSELLNSGHVDLLQKILNGVPIPNPCYAKNQSIYNVFPWTISGLDRLLDYMCIDFRPVFEEEEDEYEDEDENEYKNKNSEYHLMQSKKYSCFKNCMCSECLENSEAHEDNMYFKKKQRQFEDSWEDDHY